LIIRLSKAYRGVKFIYFTNLAKFIIDLANLGKKFAKEKLHQALNNINGLGG
jgi:ABC-type uncharacterized transport system permease subunit